LAEIDLELCAVSFVNGRRNVLKLLKGEEVEDIPISKFVFDGCSDFRKDVYRALLRIPRGTTKTYSEIASQIGRPRAYRAVAQACSANILAVVIPCHRVVASNGSLGGYSCGVDIKRQLLNIESLACVLKTRTSYIFNVPKTRTS
uniref:Methylated-DNA--protein-cysteine methyltransferase n=1 Tax=Angiostrongylus costaricensis TaxID=334426 RepID=A0A0R3PL13_ANGCS